MFIDKLLKSKYCLLVYIHAKTIKCFLQFLQICNKTAICNYSNILNRYAIICEYAIHILKECLEYHTYFKFRLKIITIQGT